MEEMLKQVLDKLGAMDRKMDDKFEQIDRRFEQIEKELKVVTEHVAKINENQVVLIKDFNNYAGLVNFHAVKIDRLEYDVAKLKAVLV